jgi:hypothetical protein
MGDGGVLRTAGDRRKEGNMANGRKPPHGRPEHVLTVTIVSA